MAVKERPAAVRNLANAAHLYRLGVRERPLQELLALMGIAAGVALLFAVQVASSSVTGAVDQLLDGVTGRASLQMTSRSQAGMQQRYVERAQRLDGVRASAPVLQRQVSVAGDDGEQAVTLIGVDRRLEDLGGRLVEEFTAKRDDLDSLGLFLPADLARQLGASPGQPLAITAGATTRRVILAGTLDSDDLGALAGSAVALAPLGTAQGLAGMPGRVNSILIEPRPGQQNLALHGMRELSAGRFDVGSSHRSVDLLRQALRPDQQSGLLFSVVAVLIGLLFAYNAMLLSMASRRRVVAHLKMIGADTSTIVTMLVIEALVLGVVASAIGIGLGSLLLEVAFRSVPDYLAAGFPVSTQHVVGSRTIAVATAGGVIAAAAASITPAIGLLRAGASAPEGPPKRAGATGSRLRQLLDSRRLLIGVVIIVVSSAAAMIWPPLTPLGIIGLIGGLIFALGPILAAFVGALGRVTRVRGSAAVALSVNEMAANKARSAALAMIAAGAVTALVAIGGARTNLENAVHGLVGEFFGTSQLWVAPSSESNVYATEQFDATQVKASLLALPEVKRVDAHFGTFVDIGNRRLRLVARPADDPAPVVASQITTGNAKEAERRLRGGGWLTLSGPVADQHHYRVGDQVVLPTPAGERRYRLAATTANYGWPSGTIVMNGDDYAKAWSDGLASSLAVGLKPGVPLAVGEAAVQSALGADSPLRARTAQGMVDQRARAFTQGMARLQQISILVLGAGVLAIVAAMSAAVWQRRFQLASLRTIGVHRTALYKTVLAESGLIVLLGAICGLLVGLYGQIFASRWVEMTTDYLAPYQPALGLGLSTLVQVVLLALVASSVPAYFASRTEPRMVEGE